MKNLLISLLACAISFALTFFILQYSSSENSYNETETPVNNNQNKEETTPSEEENNTENVSNSNTSENEEEFDNNESIPQEENQKEDTDNENTANKTTYKLNINPTEIEKDYKAWKKYNNEYIELSYEFTPIDTDGTTIKKETFLEKLKTGLYIPLKVESNNLSYQLYKLTLPETKEKIGKSIKGRAVYIYNYFKKEGQPMPDFDFKDLNGIVYNSKKTLGKIKIIKCWFIKCFVCVQEFPKLNKLYDKYEGHNNVIFLSFAFDKSDELKTFLSKKEFRYPVIPEKRNFMSKELGISQYPTHIIVDENNKILKMVNNVKALITIVDELADNGKIKQKEDTKKNYEENEDVENEDVEDEYLDGY